jgi:DMSO reductase family type II enzyme heme b subunit
MIRGLGAIVLSAVLAPALAAQDADAGKVIYDRWCAGCHGESGAGDGESAAYMLPRPRDFTRAVYQIRTTASGGLPTDADLRRVIEEGMPGTTMPGWTEKLNRRQIDNVIAYLKTFSRVFDGTDPEVVRIGSAPGVTDEGLAEGRRLYEDELECLRCHGNGGRGDGTSAPELTDDWDFPILAADLTEPWTFNGGSSTEEIYTRMYTGLDGTPMPSFADVITSGIITEEQLWRAAQYVRSLAPDDEPERRDVVRAALSEGALPSGPGDAQWEEIEAYYIPLVAQITLSPRWFTPGVDAVWVRAAHDGQQLAMRLTWNDRNNSPDQRWEPLFQNVRNSVESPDTPLPETQGPDIFGVQLPLVLPEGTELPYFIRGEPRRPVSLMEWTSNPDSMKTGTATGMGTFAAAGGVDVRHQAVFGDGQWHLQVTRPLQPADAGSATPLVPGRPIPIAFYAADGTNGETAERGAISAWYSIYLDVPTPSSVYVAPIVAVLLTAAVGVVIVWRAQQGERRS